MTKTLVHDPPVTQVILTSSGTSVLLSASPTMCRPFSLVTYKQIRFCRQFQELTSDALKTTIEASYSPPALPCLCWRWKQSEPSTGKRAASL